MDDGPKPPKGDSSVGYRRPPRHTQFKPGRSGNPRGRPAGVKSLGDIMRRIVSQKITVTEGGRTRRIPRLEAILRQTASEATRGDFRSRQTILQLAERHGESGPSAEDGRAMAAEDLAILRRFLPQLEGPAAPEQRSDDEGEPER